MPMDAGVGLVFFVGLLCFIVNLAIPYFVYTDAESKGNEDAVIWALLAFVAPVIGLLVYLLVANED